MKLKIATVFIITAFLIGANYHAEAQNADLWQSANILMYPKPQPVSNLELTNVNGRSVSLNDFKGKVVLLHFWSIQCPACRMEEPSLDKLKRTFGPAGLEILGVNLVDPPQAISQHAGAKGTPFPVLHDGGRGFKLRGVNIGGKTTAFLINPIQEAILEVPAFPTTYIIDCRGSAVGYSVGAASWDSAVATNLIKNLIEDRKNCMNNTSGPVKRLSMAE
jgi:thiol-disulfide isomerase/thioredoxin